MLEQMVMANDETTTPLAKANQRFVDAARLVDFEPEVNRYPAGTRTAADAAAAVGCDVAQIVKSLVFVGDATEPLLALTSGANRVDTNLLCAVLGVQTVRQANADEVRAATGYAIGGTPPFGHPEQLRTVIDTDLLGHARVWAACGTPDSCFPITPNELLRIANATPATIAESG